jgi:hypothetical protein
MVGSIVRLLAIGVAAGAGTPQSVSFTVADSPAADSSGEPSGGPRFTNPGASEQKCCQIPVFQSAVFASPARIQEHFDRRGGTTQHRQGSKKMPTTELKSPRAEPSTAVRTDPTCAACPHEWDAHDSIGIRFCSATVAGQLHRGCVCVGNDCDEDRRCDTR